MDNKSYCSDEYGTTGTMEVFMNMNMILMVMHMEICSKFMLKDYGVFMIEIQAEVPFERIFLNILDLI